MYVAACYPVGTTISKTSSLFTALLQHYVRMLCTSSLYRGTHVAYTCAHAVPPPSPSYCMLDFDYMAIRMAAFGAQQDDQLHEV